MRAKTSLLLLVGVCAVSIGCRTTLEYSYWQPDFSSEQQTSGDPALDVDSQLGVVTDENVVVYDLIGDAGRNRCRIDYWKIHGEGAVVVPVGPGYMFDGDNYVAGEDVETVMDLEALGILWEPALIKMDGFRLRIAVGLDLIRFAMTVEDLGPVNAGLTGTVEVPGPDGPLSGMGLDYMPIPKVGLSFEADMTSWIRIHARAQMFDASYLDLDDRFDGTFTNAVGGLVFGKHRGIRAFVGYRYFNADYDFDGDTGNSTLQGLLGSVSLRF